MNVQFLTDVLFTIKKKADLTKKRQIKSDQLTCQMVSCQTCVQLN